MSRKETEPGAPGAIPISPSLTMDYEPEALEQKNHPVGKRVFYLSIQAIINAIVIGFVAKILVGLITLITNIAFYGKF
ncbi:MAG: hypothetical protein JSS96_16625, partial [Bacteroidetes bacterium]|nr:hypothetical protein [Bacteroidota bacterium]